jgi:hypothetical protein
MKTSSSRFQAPGKIPEPGSNTYELPSCILDFEAWCFSGVWSLELGAF